ncbi:hypothetical protein [Chroococcus sp. FPU101]|uniref:hypothetical protein n=1 Tax=Chroococcus sp. FPU101 TaxID=1974212 RepID=UPI001A8F763C|nr:hypothetical protein [Chroococcus sp. FPU101]GFE69415.1 hypothetical protein CFPU101_20250 [Chroococcus sp. FPU101]
MVQFDPSLRLPTSDELLDSDDLPVDNELQTLVPNFLRFILSFIWSTRLDWFFGVNMGDQHEPFEMYCLVDGIYQRRIGEPFWMPEVGLGIGRAWGVHDRVEREWLYWYDEHGRRYLSPEEQALVAQNRSQQLEEILRSLGVDPDTI